MFDINELVEELTEYFSEEMDFKDIEDLERIIPLCFE